MESLLAGSEACNSKARIARLRAELEKMGLGALCVRDTSNIYWLTAFDDVFDEERAHALFIDSDTAVLHTDSRYATACEAAAHANGDAVAVDSEPMSQAKFAVLQFGGAAVAGRAQQLGIEDSITLAEYRALEHALRDAVSEGDASPVPQSDGGKEEDRTRADVSPLLRETDGIVVALRSVKDPTEIARMKAAQAITDAAFSHIITYMKPGMTERDVQIELDDYMYRHGAAALAFPSIIATGANGALPHAIPGDTPLEAGQCVVMDFGARAHGYCSDMTRTVFLGRPDGEMLAAWETMRRANEEVEAMLRPGITGAEAHEHAEEVLAQGGFKGRMGHGLGHGVGIDIHEEPVLSPRNKKPLVAGNVVTVEPGIYIPGRFGMRLEDFGVITDEGFECFTQSTHDLTIV